MPTASRAESDAARARAREAHAKRASKEALIRERVKAEMAQQAAAARSRALEEMQLNGGTPADRQDEMFGSALKVLMRELPPAAKARPSAPPAPAAEAAEVQAEGPPAEPALSAFEQLSLEILQEKREKDREMEEELEQLALRRAARRQATQLTRDRLASGLGGPQLAEDRAAAHTSLFSWAPPPLPATAPPAGGEGEGEER